MSARESELLATESNLADASTQDLLASEQCPRIKPCGSKGRSTGRPHAWQPHQSFPI